MIPDRSLVRVGSRVSYEDMANPRRDGIVEEVIQHGGVTPSGLPLPRFTEYRVRWDEPRDGVEEVTSDLLQHGWRLL